MDLIRARQRREEPLPVDVRGMVGAVCGGAKRRENGYEGGCPGQMYEVKESQFRSIVPLGG